MSKQFTFVAGDIGAANAMLPVMQKLAGRGHSVIGISDSAGLAGTVWSKSGLDTYSAGTWKEAFKHVLRPCLLVVGTSATATGLERETALQGREPVVLFSDGYFNHASPVWRGIDARCWLALDEGHASAIRALPTRTVDDVFVSGQPAFDDAIALLPKKGAVRAETRSRLGVKDETSLVLWWSTGMGNIADEDLAMVHEALRVDRRPLAFAPRLHPKLDKTVRGGYCRDTLDQLRKHADKAGVQWVDAATVLGIELCLAADVIVSITCTEDIKSTLIGGPPVVHLLGPKVREWMECDLFLQSPHYLPDVASGLSLAAYSATDVQLCVRRALDPTVREILRAAWKAPDCPAADHLADILKNLATHAY